VPTPVNNPTLTKPCCNATSTFASRRWRRPRDPRFPLRGRFAHLNPSYFKAFFPKNITKSKIKVYFFVLGDYLAKITLIFKIGKYS
jgi:hypothetical protein